MELSKAIIVNAEDSVSRALSLMKKTGQSALVFSGKKYIGLIDERIMREKRMDPTKTKCSKMVIKTPVLEAGGSVLDVCTAFFAGRFKTLPVIDGTKVLGTIDRWSIMSAVEKAGFLKGHKVSEHMSSPIMTVNSHSSASVANAIMRDANVRRLAVVENGVLVGVVSVFDLLPTRESDEQKKPKMKSQRKSQESIAVYSFMKRQVEVIDSNASLAEATRKMLNVKRAALVVVDDMRPVGIITGKDILKTAVRSQMRLPVIISGLDGIDRELSNDIISAGEKLLNKLKGEGASGLSIHIKNEGRQYFVSAHLTGDIKFRAHATDFELMAAVHGVMDEIGVQARRSKRTGISKRRN